MPPSWKETFDHWLRRWEGLSYGQQRMFQTLALLAILAACAPPAYFAARPWLNHWRHRHALAQAAQFEQQGDLRNLVLALHRAVQISPGDVATWRWVARTLDALGTSDALVAHENIVALAPNDAQARAALAAAALRLGSPDTARAALQNLERDPTQRESYLRLAAELARADEDLLRYAELLRALAQLRPAEGEIRFNLAVLELAQTSSAAAQSGRATLVALLDEPQVRVRAALELLRYAARRRDAELATATVHAILGRNPSAAPKATSDPWPILVAELQRSARDGGEADIARLAQWLGTVRRGREALTWIDRLPDELRMAPNVRETAVELAARTDDLARTQSLLVAGAWGPVQAEAVHAAIDSRTARLAQREGAALTRWQEAIRFADQSPVTLRALARLARLWQDHGGAEIAAKSMLRLRPQSPWANRELRDIYFARGDTAKLLAHYAAWATIEPNRPALIFGWVRTAAALNRVDDTLDQLTKRLHVAPAHPVLIDLARALVLWRRQPADASVQLLRNLPSAAQQLPETALVQALVLQDPHALAQVTATERDFLPEERVLVKALSARSDKHQ